MKHYPSIIEKWINGIRMKRGSKKLDSIAHVLFFKHKPILIRFNRRICVRFTVVWLPNAVMSTAEFKYIDWINRYSQGNCVDILFRGFERNAREFWFIFTLWFNFRSFFCESHFWKYLKRVRWQMGERERELFFISYECGTFFFQEGIHCFRKRFIIRIIV